MHVLRFMILGFLLVGCSSGNGSSLPVTANKPIGMADSLRSASVSAFEADALSYKLLYRFQGTPDGQQPSGLVDVGGTLYGLTQTGGASNSGTVFAVTGPGKERIIYSFKGGADGAYPFSTNLINVNGTLYGTTSEGGTGVCLNNGSGSCGTVFEVTAWGKERVLYSFKGGADGEDPFGLIDVDGTLYGTTNVGGGTGCPLGAGCGTVFAVTTYGKETVLYRFKGGQDGFGPFANLIAVNGTLYGTTQGGGGTTGCNGSGQGDPTCGTVFRVSRWGDESVVYRFQPGTDASNPQVGLIDVGGTLYGTSQGGAFHEGTVYAVSQSGNERVLYSFKGLSNGAYPSSTLTNVNGTLYGVTALGGVSRCGLGCGTVFKISTSGTESALYKFKGPPDGSGPNAAVINVDGTLYGTTTFGGLTSCSQGCGTVFALRP